MAKVGLLTLIISDHEIQHVVSKETALALLRNNFNLHKSILLFSMSHKYAWPTRYS